MTKDLYADLGVDATKGAVRKAFEGGIEKDFPYAFCNIVRSQEIPGYVKTLHGDGDGSKTIPRLLAYMLTGDIKWLKGMVDDGLSMNTGDIAAAGFIRGEIEVINSIHLNGFNVPKDVLMQAIAERFSELHALYDSRGLSFSFLGGETADLPRQVQTSVFDVSISAMMWEAGVIDGNVRAGDKIWGLASDGQAAWETEENSGIMSNGLTLGTDRLVHTDYIEQFPKLLVHGESFHGRFRMDDKPEALGGMSVADALLSPTRHWAIFIRQLILRLEKAGVSELLHGISMNTGGGAAKVSNLGDKTVIFQKKMPVPPPIFQLIQEESRDSWQNMFKNFNCGVGLDVVGHEELEPYLEAVAEESDIALFDLGWCLPRPTGAPAVFLDTPYGKFEY